MKRGKRVKPVFPIEYRLLMTQKFNEPENKTITLVTLRTVNVFTNFRYDIIVDSALNDRTLRFTVRGLRAPQVNFPGLGPAEYRTEFENLRGSYEIIISKHGRTENIFSVTIGENKITLERSPRNKFAELITDENEWLQLHSVNS